MSNTEPAISSRKTDHIDLCAKEDVEYRGKTTLIEDVELIHDSLPELSVAEIDMGLDIFGKRLTAPLLITGMTGGADAAKTINRTLARVAQELGLAFGVGSQRALLKEPDLADTYQVRDVAPDIVLLGNIGAVQAADLTLSEAEGLVELIDADALCIHLNPGQELIQPEGDRDFRGCLDGISRLVEGLSVPVIVKETGCGLGPNTLKRLKDAGVSWVDTSGAGGTTWIGVETLRSPAEERSVGELFWDWGVPTAASIGFARDAGFRVIGSGGLRSGLDAARAIALGADLAGMALPWLKSAHEGGYDASMAFGKTTLQALRTAMLLTGSRDLESLKATPKLIGPRLQMWLSAAS